jgi:hypothetical protein
MATRGRRPTRLTSTARCAVAASVIAVATSVVSCADGGAVGHRTRALGALDARAVAGPAQPPHLAVSTELYRGVLARSLYARCQMFPSDSELHDRRARACGGAAAAALGVARLYLEVEASPAVLPATFVDGRLRWLDAPPPSSTCAP